MVIGVRESTVREEIELFGGPFELLGCRHVPTSPPVGGVVICSSGPFDAAVDTGRGARLGRRLALGGVAVQRFHHLGAPASDGERAQLRFASLVDDARQAADLLRDRCGVERLGFVGARLAALVAARRARHLDGAPLALWEPVVDPTTVVERAAQTRFVPQRSGVEAVAGAAPFDVFDTPLGVELTNGTQVGGLLDEMGDRPRPILLVQTGPGAALRPDYAMLAARCRARHMTVDGVCHPCDGRRDGVPVPLADAGALVDATADWLIAQLGGAVGTESAAQPAARGGAAATPP